MYRLTASYQCARTHLRVEKGEVVCRNRALERKLLANHVLEWVESAGHYLLVCDSSLLSRRPAALFVELVPVLLMSKNRKNLTMDAAAGVHVPRSLLVGVGVDDAADVE